MMKGSFKIIFFGTPVFAAEILRSLIEKEYNVAAVFTQPDKRVGRKQNIVFSPVKNLALQKKIEVFQPEDLGNEDVIKVIKNIKPDVIIVAAYGKILSKKILEIPKFGAINVHASLLPKYRGASPIQEALLAGDKKTGISLVLMNEKLDAGKIIAQREMSIEDFDNAATLTKKLAKAGGNILVETLPNWFSGKIKPILQIEKKASYCRKIKKEDGKINWKEPAEKIYRKWKAYYNWPGVYTFFAKNGNFQRLKIIEISAIFNVCSQEKPGKVIKYKGQAAVATAKGLIVLKKIQEEGKKTTDANSYFRGNKKLIGSPFY